MHSNSSTTSTYNAQGVSITSHNTSGMYRVYLQTVDISSVPGVTVHGVPTTSKYMLDTGGLTYI